MRPYIRVLSRPYLTTSLLPRNNYIRFINTMASKTNIDFYTVCLLYKILADRRMKAYIHGIKGRHAQWLEELGLQYNVHKLEFSKNQQKEPWFLEINRKTRQLTPSNLPGDKRMPRFLALLISSYDKVQLLTLLHSKRPHPSPRRQHFRQAEARF
jgi:hypothetical protein